MGGALIGAVIGSYAGKIGGYELAYISIGFVAIAMTFLAIGLKNKKEQIKTMEQSFKSIN